MEALGKTQKIRAKVPLAEMFGYSTDLRSKTQGRGDYSIRLRVTKRFQKVRQKQLLPKPRERSRLLLEKNKGGIVMAREKFERKKPHVNVGQLDTLIMVKLH